MFRALRAPLAHIAAFIASLVMILPVYLITINALKSSPEASSMSVEWPSELHFENFLIAIEKGKLVTSFLNSLLYASTATVIATLVSAMAAFVMSRHRTRFNRFLYLFLIMGIALPVNFFTLTTMMQVTHLINTKIGIIILYAALQVPFSVFLIYGFIETIPRELDEAATIDGCRPLQLFFLVVLPLLKPVLVTAGILNFLNIWNDFMMPLYYLNSSANWPMTLSVYNFFGQYQSSWNLVSADILLTIIPVIVIYLLGQRFIIAGMTSGSVKG
ncbi:carbohydrate ABC transporter permease [Oryzibacter oryziterrae]|uniref:carbohydrate ABC transporter permease n=1 Tax=Oryzibacter oryziterrae TaxID=2766474 RepID=UPI001F355CE8|nr:carbohydrate ABC transporter permease [Oryzibacter oryziterrae]